MRYHFTLIMMATIKKKSRKIHVDEDVEKLELLYAVGGNEKWCDEFGKRFGSFALLPMLNTVTV